jgi:hypothetical protein
VSQWPWRWKLLPVGPAIETGSVAGHASRAQPSTSLVTKPTTMTTTTTTTTRQVWRSLPVGGRQLRTAAVSSRMAAALW